MAKLTKADAEKAKKALAGLFTPKKLEEAHSTLSGLVQDELERVATTVEKKATGHNTLLKIGGEAMDRHVNALIEILGHEKYREAQMHMEKFGYPNVLEEMVSSFMTGTYASSMERFSKARMKRIKGKLIPTLTPYGTEMLPAKAPSEIERLAIEATEEQIKMDKERHSVMAGALAYQIASVGFGIDAKCEENEDRKKELLAQQSTMKQWIRQNDERMEEISKSVNLNLMTASIKNAMASRKRKAEKVKTKERYWERPRHAA